MSQVKGHDRVAAHGPLVAWLREGEEPGIAPAPLERVRALLNTDDRFHQIDRLAGGPAALRELRDGLRSYLTTRDTSMLDEVAARHPLRVRFGPVPDVASRLEPAGAPDALGDALAQLLAVVHEAHAGGAWERLKECRNPDCRWVYYDTSRNRSGRWCSMGECGDVMKARAYRERRRTGAAVPD